VKLAIRERRLALRAPLRAAWGSISERVLLEVYLDGGRGEAAPLEPYDGVPLAACRAALEGYAEALAPLGEDATGPEVLQACRAVAELPQALAAIDMALWDRAGRRSGTPVAHLLTDRPLDRVAVNATEGVVDPEEAVRQGYRVLKVKAGLGDDAERLRAIRSAVGDALELRLDANGAWSVDEAAGALAELAPIGLELAEEPVHGVASFRALRPRAAVPIALDETASEAGALAGDVADAVCLKVGACGGITPLLARATLARANGIDVYVASAHDGPLGVAAALHAAAALRIERPCGLATLGAFAEVEPGVPAPAGGAIALPSGPGLLGS
jgi:L-alanine-DL-glutamate epimerase-like enolase superfamily enzyme